MNSMFMMQNILGHAPAERPGGQGLDPSERMGLYWCRNFDHYFDM
jgi:hypothetical protein